jgi:FkbM family methyltransferase
MKEVSPFNREEQIPTPLLWLRRLGSSRRRIKGRERLLKWLVPMEKCTFFPFEVDFYGLRYRGNLNNIVDWHVFFYGAYAKSELAILRNLVNYFRGAKGAVNFADIGTNAGVHALFMSRIADWVLGFEPVGQLWQEAQDKIASNKINNVRIVNCALGVNDEQLPLYLPEGTNLGNASLLQGFVETNSPDPIFVDVRRGDDIFRAEERRFNIVKVDVEGFELSVCEGLQETLRRDRPVLLLELWHFNAARFETHQDFLKCFYPDAVVQALKGAPNGAYRLEPYDVTTHRQGEAELLILPREHADFLNRYSECPWL